MADCMYAINANAAAFGGGGMVNQTYREFRNPAPPDTRTGEEIAVDVIRRAGLEVVMD